MGGYWYRDRQVHQIQCPNPQCQRVFSSGKSDPQCSKCGTRFSSDGNFFKTPDDRKAERKVIFELIRDLKSKQNEMASEFNKKLSENNEIIKRVEKLLMPIS